MAELRYSSTVPTKAEKEDKINGADELDHIPLVQRREMLLARIKTTGKSVVAVTKEDEGCDSRGILACPDVLDSQSLLFFPSLPPVSDTIDQPLAIQPDDVNSCSAGPGVTYSFDAADQCSQNDISCQDSDMTKDQNSQGIEVNTEIVTSQSGNVDGKTICLGMKQVDASDGVSPGKASVSENLAEIKIEHSDDHLSSLGDSLVDSAFLNEQSMKHKTSPADNFSDDHLDHMILKDRLRKLLPRKILTLSDPVLEPQKLITLPTLGKRIDMISTSQDNPTESNSDDRLDCLRESTDGFSPPPILHLAKVKAEPLDNTGLCKPESITGGNPSNTAAVKFELDSPDDSHVDNVDHMQLCNRMKLQNQGRDLGKDNPESCDTNKKIFPSTIHYTFPVSEASRPIRIIRPRKRRKTATNSVETALEEDAPGLLQVLVEQGVSVDEIKLYGENEVDEPINESFVENSFGELEAVISKLFVKCNSLLKFASVRCTKGTKPSYCLACLFSLVEQARYLRFCHWPAEWGWCRDLQSFIFVFERHNRIVLERPEYGYATYFFELVDAVPVDWQIKRLVTAMKLTSCGRITLIENKALLLVFRSFRSDVESLIN